ncbi:sphingomyelin phosphodiesterase [Athelia psychrophila]|uniref:Sphingomyelin phosphodiesterase n=1 Tax=Athelia psychrophila TaxID=1759441 RepID=A0A165YZZ1_9AGAM|nr:sphingomyelin phosphodiesterase [Fibularhizoctonia sp. CBS 109695]
MLPNKISLSLFLLTLVSQGALAKLSSSKSSGASSSKASSSALSVSASGITPSTYTAGGAFPTSLFSKYYNNPTATSAQPQPVVSDPVTHKTYAYDLTNPTTIPINDTQDPHPLPPRASSSLLLAHALTQVESLANSPVFANDKCGKCLAGLQVAKFLAMAAPEEGPTFAVTLCEKYAFSSTCAASYGINALGGVITQVIANADVAGLDGQLICQNFLSLCPLPPASPLNLTNWFASPKPDPLPAAKTPSGERLKVLHISDFHLDPRYATGAESNCTSGLCCRANNFNPTSPNKTLTAAPRFGAYGCDSPISLITSALASIPELAGTKESGFAWTVYTGDLVAHDPENQLSRDYIEYTEAILYDLFKRTLGTGPVYAAIGNHDSYNQAQDAPHAIGGPLADQFSWNYDHVAELWGYEGWLPAAAVKQAKSTYSAYSVQRSDGLRIISLNTNLWYKANYFNYINMTDPDTSGMLRFLTDELQDAETAGDRVWVMGHVLSGWDGSNPLLNPSDLFYQIVDRFTPHVIANIFFGHTHEDQLSIFYANNGTAMNSSTAGTVAWIGPSVTPLTNLNSGFRVYEVDSVTFDIVDAHTWKADVSTFPSLDGQTENGPAYAYEYNTREAYGGNITWAPNDPLNATWWHLVTESMEANASLVTDFNTYQGKSSSLTPDCTGACATAKICYMRSGSAPIAMQNCVAGYASVQ